MEPKNGFQFLSSEFPIHLLVPFSSEFFRLWRGYPSILHSKAPGGPPLPSEPKANSPASRVFWRQGWWMQIRWPKKNNMLAQNPLDVFLIFRSNGIFFFEDGATGPRFFLALTHFGSSTLWVVSIIVLSNQLASTPVLVSGTTCLELRINAKKRWFQTHVEVWHVSYNQVPEPIYQVPLPSFSLSTWNPKSDRFTHLRLQEMLQEMGQEIQTISQKKGLTWKVT